jgi:Lsr2
MAQKVTVVLEDDLTGGPAEQTVRFAFDGTDYEIDLSAKNAAAFSKLLGPYIEHGRKAGRAQSRRPGRTAANRQRSGDIRAWAKEHGLAVTERGRNPSERSGAVPRGQRALAPSSAAARHQNTTAPGLSTDTAYLAGCTHHRVSVREMHGVARSAADEDVSALGRVMDAYASWPRRLSDRSWDRGPAAR